ncbi:MAG: hypothetical protein MUF54_19080 [Polyangiaceae bacterium]|nr:hypothetical protein [Polyangiaceae bacterium]
MVPPGADGAERTRTGRTVDRYLHPWHVRHGVAPLADGRRQRGRATLDGQVVGVTLT